jgi:hypothetical protein
MEAVKRASAVVVTNVDERTQLVGSKTPRAVARSRSTAFSTRELLWSLSIEAKLP